MNKTFIVLILVIKLLNAQKDLNSEQTLAGRRVEKSQEERENFKVWKKVQRKKYKSENDEDLAADNYVLAKRRVAEFNRRKNETYKQDIQKYSDQDPKVLKKQKAGMKAPPNIKYTTLKPKHVGADESTTEKNLLLPERTNYTSLMQPAKDQLNCGSCYVFAVVALIEYYSRVKFRRKQTLSEQNVLDCDNSTSNYGCVGGWPSSALDYIKANGIADGRKGRYEYVGHQESCNKKVYPSVRKIVHYCSSTLDGDENLLKSLVAKGPVVVGVSLTLGMMYYRKGVFFDQTCTNEVDHAVTIVGYDTDEVLGDFWIVRNSWGKSWGQNGYGWFARNKNNSCGIANVAFYLC